jgi:hypothetical protein
VVFNPKNNRQGEGLGSDYIFSHFSQRSVSIPTNCNFTGLIVLCSYILFANLLWLISAILSIATPLTFARLDFE